MSKGEEESNAQQGSFERRPAYKVDAGLIL